MASITAVELGADSCAFARTSTRRGDVHLSAVEILDPAAFPGLDGLSSAVRQTRRSLGLPRKSRVVLWGLPDGASRKDHAVKPLLAPLTKAGFRVDRVVTPCNALAALARLKPSRGHGAACWVAINRGGVAIVVLRPGKLLYAHSFVWDSQIGASGSQARLLQRYSLVSYLAPEVKRAIAEARRSGTAVDAVVTCGNLPDLRALTMPLIEELDVEVETLDSFEGLGVKPSVAEKLSGAAPAIRLACAAAIARGTRPWDPSRKRNPSREVTRYVAAAAVVLAVAGVGYQWKRKPRHAAPPAFVVSLPPAAPALSDAAKRPESKGAVSVPAKAPESNPPAVAAVLGSMAAPAPVVTSPLVVTSAVLPARSPMLTTSSLAPSAPAKESEARGPANAPVPSNAAPRPESNARALSDAAKTPESKGAVSVTAKAPASNPPALNPTAISTDNPDARVLSPRPAARRGLAPAPLTDAVPQVTAILVSRDRRFATVGGGQIVGIGDVLGRRTVVTMDERSVVFQEPSGVRIRVGTGGRLLGIERAER